MGFEYNILEGFWSRWPDDSLRALVDYSKKLGVGIIVWKHSKELHDAGVREGVFSTSSLTLELQELKLIFSTMKQKR